MSLPRERFGYHVVCDRDLYDAVDFASTHGFGYIVPDLMIPRFWPENYGASERRRIREYAEARDVSISFHAPSDNLNIGSPYPEVRRGVLRRMRLCLEFARDLGAERFTIHPTRPPDFSVGGGPGTYLDDHREFYEQALREGIRAVAAEADGIQICVENDPLTLLVENVLEKLLAEGIIFLTLDVPKACDPSKGVPLERVRAFYERNLGMVREVHLHDRRPGGRYHDLLGAGGVDIGRYLRMFKQGDAHITLEIRPRENAYRSLVWLERRWDEF